ncbi:hypothetical protein Q604_UNBC09320G0001, partial [human gut metagenome]
CKRAIDENCFFSDEVPDRWGDCIAARNLGITTFLSTPIHLPDGSFYGTLCAASSEKRQWSERAEQVLQLFAGLIAQYIQKEALVEQLREANAALIAQSLKVLAKKRLVKELVLVKCMFHVCNVPQ